MKLERSIEIQRQGLMQLRDAYSRARHFSYTSADLNKAVSEVFGRLPKGTSRHVREFMRGYGHALSDGLYSDLVFGGYMGDVFYSTHRDRPDYYEKHGVQPSDYADNGKVTRRGHYWRETLKPFFVG